MNIYEMSSCEIFIYKEKFYHLLSLIGLPTEYYFNLHELMAFKKQKLRADINFKIRTHFIFLWNFKLLIYCLRSAQFLKLPDSRVLNLEGPQRSTHPTLSVLDREINTKVEKMTYLFVSRTV